MCYNTPCRDLQMGAFFMPNNPILRGKDSTITLGLRPVSLDSLRSSGGIFAYGVTMTKKDGKPCKKCGTSEWYSNGNCRQCGRDYGKDYYQDNKEIIKEREAERQKNNLDKFRGYNRKYREKHPERARDRLHRWYEDNKDRVYAKKQKRRAKEAGNGGSYTAKEWKALCKQYDNCCLACGEKGKLTPDHVIPIVRGGTSDISNIQPLCITCNKRKHTKTTDYRTKPGGKRWKQGRLL